MRANPSDVHIPDFRNRFPRCIIIVLPGQAVEVPGPDLTTIVSEDLLEVVLHPGDLHAPGGLGPVVQVAARHVHGLSGAEYDEETGVLIRTWMKENKQIKFRHEL